MAEFRQRHLKEFKKLFGQVARIAAEAGLVKLGRVAVDGCKIKANASKHKAMSYSRMLEEEKRLEGEIAELLDRASRWIKRKTSSTAKRIRETNCLKSYAAAKIG